MVKKLIFFPKKNLNEEEREDTHKKNIALR